MTDKQPKWPDSLPHPVEINEGARRCNLMPDDLETAQAVRDLVHDLYWFPHDSYFLFFVYGTGIGVELNNALGTHGITMKKTELYFYRNPNPAYKNDFLRVLPHSDAPEWQKEAAKGQMFGRITLSLEPWRRKQLDFKHTAQVTTKAITDRESIIEMKPNIWGIGVNVPRLMYRVKGWWSRR